MSRDHSLGSSILNITLAAWHPLSRARRWPDLQDALCIVLGGAAQILGHPLVPQRRQLVYCDLAIQQLPLQLIPATANDWL